MLFTNAQSCNWKSVQRDRQTLTCAAQCASPARLTDTLDVSRHKTSNAGTIHSTVSTVTMVSALETTHFVLRIATIIRSAVLSHFSNVQVIYLQQTTAILTRSQHSHECKDSCRQSMFSVTRDLRFMTSKSMAFQNSSWNISMWSLVILPASVFEISCRKTDRHTDNAPIMLAIWCQYLGTIPK